MRNNYQYLLINLTALFGIPMDRGAWRATVNGVTESDTTEQLSKAQPRANGHLKTVLR